MKYNRRQFTRIKIQRDVRLDFGKNKYASSISNFSLGGMYIQGCFDQQIDDICTIKFNISYVDSDVKINAICLVVRVDQDGLALKFTSMEPDNFLILQEALLYPTFRTLTHQKNIYNLLP
ncbi:MAG: PilZ domain-containing protein [Gammaproteobacteria bacterium]|nr:PilZ domain-containing protein [Gammaproteobacteria bacterium]